MLIRRATSTDKPELLKLIDEIDQDYSTSNRRAQFNWPLSKAESILNHYFVLLTFGDGGESQAFICYQELSGDYEIIALGVSPRFQNKGLMRKLLGHFVDFVCTKESKIFLEVHEKNTRALRLYESSGFRIDGIRKNYYSDGSAALNLSKISI